MTSASYGDLGDVIFLCPCMKLIAEQSGSPVILYCRDGLRPWDPFTAKIPILAPLLESQDYIEAILPWNGETVDYDTCFWRDMGYPYGVTLGDLQAQWLRINPDFSHPWLKISKETPLETIDKIVINRSARYHNPFFPWKELVTTFAREMLFIGLRSEHEAFEKEFGRVEYLPTETLLEAAQAIAGSELFIGNQSSCGAIAEGLKHNSIQETSLSTPDCIYPRANAVHCHDGALDFILLDQHFTSKNKLLVRAHLNETPPGGWSVTIGEHKANSYAFNLTLEEISSKLRKAGVEVPKNLKDVIIEQNSTTHIDHPVARLKAQLYA